MKDSLARYDSVGRMSLFGLKEEHITSETMPNDLEALSKDYFFNSLDLRKALDFLSPGLSEKPGERIAVYFNQIQGLGVTPGRALDENQKRNWWLPLQEHFLPGVKKMPVEVQVKYFYGTGAKPVVSSEFNPSDKSLYQIFVRMFGSSLKAFSCFVGTPAITIDSWNYFGENSFNKFGHTDRLPWYGTLGNFLESAEMLEETLKEMGRKGYKTGHRSAGAGYTDVRLVHPESGMIIMRVSSEKIRDLNRSEDGKLKFGQKEIPKTIILPSGSLEDLAAA